MNYSHSRTALKEKSCSGSSGVLGSGSLSLPAVPHWDGAVGAVGLQSSAQLSPEGRAQPAALGLAQTTPCFSRAGAPQAQLHQNRAAAGECLALGLALSL